MAAAYALALQMVLSALAGPLHGPSSLGSLDGFVICHSDDAGTGSGKHAVPNPCCVLCALTHELIAIPPTGQNASALNQIFLAVVFVANNDRVIQYRSPTGQYQRGPPPRAIAVG